VVEDPKHHQEPCRDYPGAFQQPLPIDRTLSPAFELDLIISPTGAPPVAGGVFVRAMELHRLFNIYPTKAQACRFQGSPLMAAFQFKRRVVADGCLLIKKVSIVSSSAM
jgi:hypothetical protein